MKILFLTKRIYTGKDLLADRYGRMYELPVALRGAGYDLQVACLSYHPVPDPARDPGGGVTWRYWYTGSLRLPGIIRHATRLARIVREYRPDVIVGASDAIHVILAYRLARRFHLPLIIDLYDNFEGFSLTRLPGVSSLFRRAVRAADGVSVVSRPLHDLIARTCGGAGTIMVIENAVPARMFAPGNREVSRQSLGLPVEGCIIGTAGALYRSRGVETLYEAFRRLCARMPNLHLALAGSIEARARPPHAANVHYLGNLSYETVPVFLNALDVGVICVRPDPFGLYSFPQKAYEMVASGTPMVAARVGALVLLLENWPEILYEPGDPDSLVKAITLQIERPIRPALTVPDWAAQGCRFEDLIRAAVASFRAR